MNREYHRWHSPALGRDMELLILGHAGVRVVVFPTRCGRFFDYEDFGLASANGERIERGELQFYCVDSVDQEGLYADWMRREDRILRQTAFEHYILDEVLPLTEARNGGGSVVAHGCSLGAYHAVNFSLRHPNRFNRVVALSGRYDLTVAIDGYRDLFDGYQDENIYLQMPNQYLGNVDDPHYLSQLRNLKLTLVAGETDPCVASTRHLAELLAAKQIPYDLHIWQNRAHSPKHWIRMVQLYL